MKTKQEVVDFLESKVGTKVVCVGNPSLDGQCVTLIKSLMEFLGVPDPYKARGHAKTVISAYLSEGIAKPGMGFMSVFSNKDMGAGFGHIWCNAGDGAGTFYESNGVQPLLVTKGKTYSYDNVCNFDSYIKGESMSEIDDLKLENSNLKKEVLEKNTQIQNYSEQVSGWSKKYEEEHNLRTEAEASAKGFRDQFNNFVATLAQILGTRQETVEIISSIQTCIGFEDKADELTRRIEREEREHTDAVSGLEAKIKTLESNLESLKAEFKAVKDGTIPPVVKESIFNIIKNIWEKIWQK